MTKKIIGRECRHATYVPTPKNCDYDLHVVKEIRHFDDGTIDTNINQIRNFKRDFWITVPGRRNHKEKKECESLENLTKYSCTESDLTYKVAQALKIFGHNNNRMNVLARSPYLYGTDITSTAILKHAYQNKYPNFNTPMSIAATDVETDMLNGTNDIIIQTISFKDKMFTAVLKSFVSGFINVEVQLQKMLMKYLGDDVKARNITWEIMLVDTPGQVVCEILKRAHQWQPDFISIWNILFDMDRMLVALKKDGIDPADVFSDPSIPYEYKTFRFNIGPEQKTTSDGTQTPRKPAQRWHSVKTPSGFTLIDSMCAYYHIRTGSQEEPSYTLDAILDKEVKRHKLNFKEADGFSGADWHRFMQEYYKLEYIIYNSFDCIGLEILDEKTNDLSISLSMFAGSTDYARFNSQPTRLCDDLHWYMLEVGGMVLGSTSDEMGDEKDKLTTSGKGWIVMLAQHLTLDNGLKCLTEYATVPSNIRAFNSDLDVEGAYPNTGMAMNVSKSTTKRELIKISGVSEALRRRAGIDLSAGYVNSIDISCSLFKLPTLDQMYASFLREEKKLYQD